ncbi:MAG: MATE family efflux transporter [Deltaproteobacteria bacterium]|nr:MATE family efflux transporter [Deltaproteobacteria bacterium]
MTAPRPRTELAAQIHLAVPLVAQQLGLQLMGLVDTALLGRYDADAMAGATIAGGLVFAISCIGMGVVLGLDTLVPQAIGAGDPGRASQTFRAGLKLALAVGLPLTLLVLVIPLVLEPAGVAPAIARPAREFAWVRAIGVAPFLLQVAMRAFLSAHGHTRPLIIAVIAGNIVNALGDWILIFGDAGLADFGLPAIGLPALGVIGAGLSTTGVQLVTVLIYGLAARAIMRSQPPAKAPGERAWAIARHGLPVGLMLLAEVGVFTLAGVLAAHLGKGPAAGHSVAIMVASFTFSMAVGVGASAAVRVGHAIGAGDLATARRRGLISLGLGTAVMSCSALAFLIIPGQLARIFTDDADAIASAIPLLRIAAVFQLSDGAQAIAAGALRGTGDTHAGFVANVIGHYAIGLPLSIGLAFVAGWGAPGLWWGLSAGLTATAVLLIARFLRTTRAPHA